MEKPGLVNLLLLPLKWLERSRGWKRRGLSFLYLVIFTVVCVLGWREVHLWRLPNIGEPFDVTKFGRFKVADSDNAFLLFSDAAALLKPASPEVRKLHFNQWTFNDWSKLDPSLKQRVEENRPAIEVWLRAADRSEFLYRSPAEMRPETPTEPITNLRELARLGMLEAARRVDSGDLEGAWIYYRAVLRSSRLVGRHGNLLQRIFGVVFLREAKSPVGNWVENPKTTSKMLRNAIRDLEECQKLAAPVSEMIQVEYLMLREVLSHPEEWRKWDVNGPEGEANWYTQMPLAAWLRHFVKREPERSQRILRLVTAGLLAQCDRPRWARPKLFSEQYVIYEVDAKTPSGVASISPQALAGWAENSGFGAIGPNVVLSTLNTLMTRFEAESGTFDSLRLRMAERAYQLDHGWPAKTYADLMGAYLKTLPDGIESVDPLIATPVEK